MQNTEKPKAFTGTLPNMEQVWKLRIPAEFVHVLANAPEVPDGTELSWTGAGGNTITAVARTLWTEMLGIPINNGRRVWDIFSLECD